ncbi:MAG: hypothetical protein MI685_08485 [Chlorobiales bacterium]|nr:hypothetical protein [Chlorobiales bacterium]
MAVALCKSIDEFANPEIRCSVSEKVFLKNIKRSKQFTGHNQQSAKATCGGESSDKA